jgi:hypothetical protein
VGKKRSLRKGRGLSMVDYVYNPTCLGGGVRRIVVQVHPREKVSETLSKEQIRHGGSSL